MSRHPDSEQQHMAWACTSLCCVQFGHEPLLPGKLCTAPLLSIQPFYVMSRLPDTRDAGSNLDSLTQDGSRGDISLPYGAGRAASHSHGAHCGHTAIVLGGQLRFLMDDGLLHDFGGYTYTHVQMQLTFFNPMLLVCARVGDNCLAFLANPV